MRTDDLVFGATAAARILGVSKSRILQLARRQDNPLGAVLLPDGVRINGVMVYYGFSRSALVKLKTDPDRLRRRRAARC